MGKPTPAKSISGGAAIRIVHYRPISNYSNIRFNNPSASSERESLSHAFCGRKNAVSVPPSALRRRFAPLIREYVRHLLSLLSNGGCWLNTPSTWANTIVACSCLAHVTAAFMRLRLGLSAQGSFSIKPFASALSS